MMSGNYFSKSYYIVIFTHREHVYVMDDYLKRNGMYKYQIVPIPCGVNKGCSYCVKINDLKDIEIIKEASLKIKTPIDSVYHIYKKDGDSKRNIKKVKGVI